MLTADETLAMLEACPAGVLVLGPDGRIRWLNQSLADFLGEAPDALIGKSHEDLAAPHLSAMLGLPELLFIPSDGAADRYLNCRALQLGTARVGFFIDVSAEHILSEENATLAKQVREQVPRDNLTGLLNSRGLFQDLERHLARSRRYDNPLAVLLLRPGGFAALEPTGASSDAVMRGIAHMLRDQLRWADSVGRLEDTAEFMLVLPETDEPAAQRLAQKLRQRLRNLTLPEGGTLAMDVAMGLSQWQRGDDAGLLVRRAREQLEAAPPG